MRQQWIVAGLSAVATCLLAVGYRAPSMPILRDNIHHFYLAERVASGVAPNLSHFQPKHILCQLLTGSAISVGRLLGVSDVASTRLVSGLVIAASIWLAWRLSFRLSGRHVTALFSFVMMLAFSGYLYFGFMGVRPKVFMVAFLLASALFLSQRRGFYAGLFGAMAYLCWQAAVVVLVIGFLVLAVRPENRDSRPALRYVVGAALGIVLYESYFVATGSLQAQLFQTYVFPAGYMTGEFAGIPRSIARMAFYWRAGFVGLETLPVVVGVGLVAGCTALAKRGVAAMLDSQIDRGWAHIVLGMLATAAICLYDLDGFPDLFFTLPFLVVLSSHFLTKFIDILPRGRRLALLMILGYFIAVSVVGVARWRPRSFTVFDQQKLGRRVAEMGTEYGPVFAIGCTHLLAFAHMDNWLPYGNSFPELDRYLEDKHRVDGFVPEKEGAMPSIVLLSRRRPAGIDGWLPVRYSEVSAPQFERQRIQVYRLRSQQDRPSRVQ